MIKIVKIRKVGGSLVISIPSKILEDAGLGDGQDVLLQSGLGAPRGTILIKNAEKILGKIERKENGGE